VTFTFTFFFT